MTGCCRRAAILAIGSRLGKGSARLNRAMQPHTHFATCTGHLDAGDDADAEGREEEEEEEGEEGWEGEEGATAATGVCKVAAMTLCIL